MNIFRIKTTAWKEEDLVLLTTLSDSQVKDCLYPIVESERDGKSTYDNDDLFNALTLAYPEATIMHYNANLEVIIL
jgi:hypothetical protein